MMINANELRINNLIISGGLIHKCTPLDILNLYQAEITENELDEYKPIPLTEEWLLKFGFLFCGDRQYVTTKKRYFDIKIGTHQFRWNNVPKHSKLRLLKYGYLWKVISPGNDSVRIEYVHQIQNLYYALTGCELKNYDKK